MRLRISHTTTYRYQPAATSVIQMLRLTPCNHDSQYVVNWQMDTSTDSRLEMHQDAFGNVMHVFTHGALEELTINVSGLVDTHDTGGVIRGTIERFPPTFFLRSTSLTEHDAGMVALAHDIRNDVNGNTLAYLHGLLTRLSDEMTYDPDPTHSGTTAKSAFALKRGVCQDYSHIFIACARAGGVPARYVSGHFLRSDGVVSQEAGHAWAEAFVPDLGWVGFDATNRICTTEAHVRVAIGLDYLDAAPIRGTRYGGGAETLSVAVTVDQAGRQSQSQSQS